MPQDRSIKTALVIGSGPIVIGQAAEFDYSGTQACKALTEEGVRVVLVNPNPATIMTDEDVADRVYAEPLTVESVARIIEIERPDGIIATMGGQAGLNLGAALDERGILSRYGVRLLGTGAEAIRKGEDRGLFKAAMINLCQPVPRSAVAMSSTTVEEIMRLVGLPCVIRPAFTLGGSGGGLARTAEELAEALQKGLQASPVRQALVESSLYGEKEIEFELVRDGAGKAIVVCGMENIDPMGIHTGDSIVVAPTLTLNSEEYRMLRQAALDIVAGLDILGSCNVQFALCRGSLEYYVIEINPRVSRSSALASKATGYPIARVAAKIALGFNLDEISNEVTGKTSASREPTIDYVAVKIPRWPWDKFPGGPRKLGLQMKSTGEVMAIGRTLEEALGKGISSVEGKGSLWDLSSVSSSSEEIESGLKEPDDTRLAWVFRALREGMSPAKIAALSGIDRFFIERMGRIVDVERQVASSWTAPTPEERVALVTGDLFIEAKQCGLSNVRLAQLCGASETEVAAWARKLGAAPSFKMVDTCAGEFAAVTPYFYSAHDGTSEIETPLGDADRPSVMVLGGGPIRIGQGIEFDYCAVHAARSLEEDGFHSIIVNNNPETVSTDFNTAGRLYFEPLTYEHVKAVLDVEKPLGVLVGFGGQTAINLVEPLHKAGITILGTSPDSIDATEDRGRFTKLLCNLGIPVIPGAAVTSLEEAIADGDRIGYPLVVRPSYVLGGRGMAIVYDREELVSYFAEALGASQGHDVLIDKYIHAIECEVDVVSDGKASYIPAILEHVERSGVHSGDSIAQIPPRRIGDSAKSKIVEYTGDLCKALRVRGIANIQYIVDGDTVYCLEVNPRASRTVPFVTKVTGFPVVRVATGLSLGRTLQSYGISGTLAPDPHVFAVKTPVFSWAKMMIDPVVGPEMKSTGEVMGIAADPDEAMLKAFVAQGITPGNVQGRKRAALLTISDRDKDGAEGIARLLQDAGWMLYATKGTASFLRRKGITAETVSKLNEGDLGIKRIPELLEAGKVDVIINTYTKGERAARDGYKIRAMGIRRGVPVLTCLETASAFTRAVSSHSEPKPIALQDLKKPLGNLHKNLLR